MTVRKLSLEVAPTTSAEIPVTQQTIKNMQHQMCTIEPNQTLSENAFVPASKHAYTLSQTDGQPENIMPLA